MGTVQVEIIPKLIPVFDGPADVRGAKGGRGSGKTRTFAIMAAIKAFMLAAEGRRGIVLCGRQFMNSLEDSSFAEIESAIRSVPWLEAAFDIGEKFIRTRDGRIHFSFIGLDRHLNSIKSKSGVLLCWVDEAESVKGAAWDKLIPTLREDGVELWVTWNPENVGSPTDKRFGASDDPLVKIATVNWRDNPRFPPVLERTRQRDARERPGDYDWIWEGAYRTTIEGAIFARELADADTKGRITKVPYDPTRSVHVLWDLGWADSTALWFIQRVGLEWRALAYAEYTATTIAEIAKDLRAKPYVYELQWLPHDADARTLGSDGKSIAQKVRDLNFDVQVVTRAPKKATAIEAARTIFPTVWFDKDGCADGINCLRHYAYKVDPETGQYSKEPEHNWASHGADAFMQLGQGVQDKQKPIPIVAPARVVTPMSRRA